jgi:hypothetical protein
LGLLRDHHVAPIAVSGADVLCLRLAGTPVAGTRMRPLVYDYYALDPSPAPGGMLLVLPRCPPRLVRALEGGMSHFFHAASPLLGPVLWSGSTNQGKGFAVYLTRAAAEAAHAPERLEAALDAGGYVY